MAFALAAGTLCWSADTLAIKTRDGNCQVTVPAGWTAGGLPGTADSADQQVSLAISSPKMLDSFAELKQTAKSIYADSKVTKDTGTEFIMEGQSMNHEPDVYRAIPTGAGKYCVVEVIYKTGGPEQPRAIAQTLKAAK